jgi:hypothetical protein
MIDPRGAMANRHATLCAVAVTLIPFVVFWPVTIGREIWAIGDFCAYQHPLFSVMAAQWRQGIVPLWNPYLNGGTPLLAAQQGAVFYPVNLPLLLFLPSWAAMGFSVLIHLALTALGTYLFLRSLKLHLIAASLGAVVLAFSGFAMSHLGHVGILRLLPWIGFALWGFNAWVDTRRRRYLWGLFAAVALMCLSGYPQIAAYGVFFTGTYVLLAGAVAPRTRLVGIVAFALGVAAAAIQVVPGVHMWLAGEYVRPGAGMFDVSMGYSFHPAYVVTLLFPRARTGTFAEMVGYVGVAPLCLALLAVFQVSHSASDRIKHFFAIWALVALLLSFGRFVPILASAVFHIPVFGSFGVPSKHLLEFSVSMAVLSAFGLDGLIRQLRLRAIDRRLVFTAGAGVGGLVLLAWTSPFLAEVPPLNWATPARSVLLPLLYVALTGVLLLTARLRSRPVAAFGLLALTLTDLLSFGLPIYSGALTSPAFYQQTPATVTAIRELGVGSGPFRVISFEATGSNLDRKLAKELLATNYSAVYGLENITAHDGLMLRRVYEAFSGRIPPWGFVSVDAVLDEQFRSKLDISGVRFLLVRTELAAPLFRYYRPVHATETVTIFENPGAHPRVSVLMNARTERADPGEGAESAVQQVMLVGNRLSAEVRLPRDGSLVHSASYAPGWRATIDGVAAVVKPSSGFLQEIQVPHGQHRVEMWYEPAGLKWGAALTALSVVLMSILCLVLPASAGAALRQGWRGRPPAA